MSTIPKPEEQRRVRKRRRVEPFSPWQILVSDRCAEMRVSTRALAEKVSTARHRLWHTTVWAWLRSPEGTPPSEIYTADLNRRLANALNITPDVLAAAFEESRRKFVLSPATAAQQGPLNVLRTLFASSHRKSWTTDEIVKLIDDIRGV